MTDIILAIGVAVFIIYTGFNVAYVMSMKRTSERLNEFVQRTEGELTTTLQELAGTLENLRKISGNISAVTDDVQQISHSVASLEKNVRESLVYLKESLGSAAEANIAGLKAGITTGVATLVRNLHEGRRDDHERGTGKD
jgi:ABC-type transporter Mla subunit MlaD